MKCEYCGNTFVREKAFKIHVCEQMARHELVKKPKGLAAYYFYNEWLKLSKFSKTASIETFINSRYFKAFINFVDFINKISLPNEFCYMKFMVEKTILPDDWTKDYVYIEYIKNLDLTYTPIQQARQTIKTLGDIANKNNCKIKDAMNYITPGSFVKLLKSRNLSPWLLFFCKSFNLYINSRLTKEQRIIISKLVDINLWKKKFENRPLDVIEMKSMAREHDL